MTRTHYLIAAVLAAAALFVAGVILGRSAYRRGCDDGAWRALNGVAEAQAWSEPYDPEGLFV